MERTDIVLLRDGPKSYPLPVYDSALTDMIDRKVCPTWHIVTRNNFRLPVCSSTITTAKGKRQARRRRSSCPNSRVTRRPDVLYLNLDEGDIEPEFRPFESNNTDQKFRRSDEKVPDRIGAAFCQPPILRAKDVGSNFGATAMREAHDYYNSQTESERQTLERVMRDVFQYFAGINTLNPDDDYSILPKVYDSDTDAGRASGNRTDRCWRYF